MRLNSLVRCGNLPACLPVRQSNVMLPATRNTFPNNVRSISITPTSRGRNTEFFPLVDGTEGESDSEDHYPILRRPKVRLDAPFDLEMVVDLLRERKMQDICVIDISEKVSWYKYFIVATGRSGSHINSTAVSLQQEAKKRISTQEFKIHQKGSSFWVIFTATDQFVINLFTEEEREEYDLERVWVMRRNEKNPLAADFDDIAETEWIYDDDDGQFDNWDPMDKSPEAWLDWENFDPREHGGRKRGRPKGAGGAKSEKKPREPRSRGGKGGGKRGSSSLNISSHLE